MAISQDGKKVVSGSNDMTVRMWDAERIFQECGPGEGVEDGLGAWRGKPQERDDNQNREDERVPKE